MNQPEAWWESLLAFIGMIGAILCLVALCLVIAPPEVAKTDVTIERVMR